MSGNLWSNEAAKWAADRVAKSGAKPREAIPINFPGVSAVFVPHFEVSGLVARLSIASIEALGIGVGDAASDDAIAVVLVRCADIAKLNKLAGNND